MKKRFNLNSKSIYNPLNISKINKLSKVKIKFKFFTKHSLNIINVARLNEQKDQISLLETIVLKIPILSSDCSTGPKVILDNGTGGLLFKRENYIDLSKKLILFKKNKKQFSKKINHAYNRLYRFDYMNNSNTYFKILIN